MESTMSGFRNNINVDPDEHMPNAYVNRCATSNLNKKNANSNPALYCFFTRTESGDKATNIDAEKVRQGKSPIPTRVTITNEKLTPNKDKNLLKTLEKPLDIIEKINKALSKLYRLAK